MSSCKAPDPVATIIADVRRAGEGADDPALAKQARQLRAADPTVLARIAALAEGSPDGIRVRAELAALGISPGALRASLKWHRGSMPKGAKAKPEKPRREVPPGVRVFERGDQSEIATATLEVLGPDPLTFDAGEFYRYSPSLGIWELLPGWQIRATAEHFAGSPVGWREEQLKVGAATTIGAEALARDRLQSIPGRITFSGAPPGIAFRNGFVTVAAGSIRLVRHAPEHRARHAYPFDYTPDAHAPLLDRFLEELFADVDQVERDARIALLQEFTGACLIGEATRYQRYLILHATGGNGKSELLRVLRALFPSDAVAALPPQKWGDQFKTIILEGKRANFVDELPDGEIMSGDSVKLVVTGEPVTGERKHRDAVTFSPIAGHIMATNTPIRSTDQSEGFWRRPVVLPLTRSFHEAKGRVLEAGKQVIEGELAAVAAWAIAGAARAQKQQGYTMPASSSVVLRQWRDESDQVRTFLSEKMLTPGETQATTAYETYKEWIKESGHAPMSRTMFGRRMLASGIVTRREAGDFRFYVRAPPEGG